MYNRCPAALASDCPSIVKLPTACRQGLKLPAEELQRLPSLFILKASGQ